jgi:hypothetical protein
VINHGFQEFHRDEEDLQNVVESFESFKQGFRNLGSVAKRFLFRKSERAEIRRPEAERRVDAERKLREKMESAGGPGGLGDDGSSRKGNRGDGDGDGAADGQQIVGEELMPGVGGGGDDGSVTVHGKLRRRGRSGGSGWPAKGHVKGLTSGGKGAHPNAEYDPKTDGKRYLYSIRIQSPYALLKSQGFKPREQFVFFFYLAKYFWEAILFSVFFLLFFFRDTLQKKVWVCYVMNAMSSAFYYVYSTAENKRDDSK